MTNPLYIEILKHGPFILVVRVPEATDGDMAIPSHFSPKDPSTYTKPEKAKVSLGSSLQLILIEFLDNVMYNNIINFILELEKDEYYTLDELDEMDQSMDYLTRKISNIRVKNPRSKIRCYNYDELGHFVTECRKPKKVKKDKTYLEFEAKYEALLKKQKGKAYIVEGKSWDGIDNEDDIEEYGSYALMDLEEGESFASKYENKTCANIAIGLDYETGKSHKKSDVDKGKESVNTEVHVVFKKVNAPLFKTCEENFSEEELIIKQEIGD
ncbi:hypothetical protein AgCh_012673 [Apium graveolens]